MGPEHVDEPPVTVLELVGAFRLRRAGSPLVISGSGQRIVALLALRGETPRTTVAGTLWPDVSDHRAQGCLRTALWRLSRPVPGLVIVRHGLLALSGTVAIDIREPAGAGLGELLPDWDDDWLLLERERVRQARLHAVEAQAADRIAMGRHAEAIEIAYRVIVEEPLRESGHRLLVEAHLAEGNVVEALRHYDAFSATVRAELGVEPSPSFTRLFGSELLHPSSRTARASSRSGHQRRRPGRLGSPK